MQHRLLEEYVVEVSPRRATDTEAQLDAEELAQHLSALADAQVELGMTEDEAAREAIRHFGAVRDVRHELKRASLRGRLVKASRTNAVMGAFAVVALSAPGLITTFFYNVLAPQVILTPDEIASGTFTYDFLASPPSVTASIHIPDAANASTFFVYGTTVATGQYYVVVALFTGFVIGLWRDRRSAGALLLISAGIASLFPFALVSVLKDTLMGWPVTGQQWAFISYMFVSLLAYAYVGAAAGDLLRRRRKFGAKRAGI